MRNKLITILLLITGFWAIKREFDYKDVATDMQMLQNDFDKVKEENKSLSNQKEGLTEQNTVITKQLQSFQANLRESLEIGGGFPWPTPRNKDEKFFFYIISVTIHKIGYSTQIEYYTVFDLKINRPAQLWLRKTIADKPENPVGSVAVMSLSDDGSKIVTKYFYDSEAEGLARQHGVDLSKVR